MVARAAEIVNGISHKTMRNTAQIATNMVLVLGPFAAFSAKLTVYRAY